MNQVFLLLGSNQGDRQKWLEKALKAIGLLGKIEKKSSVYRTAAWGLKDQDDFFNMVVQISTPFSSVELLKKIQEVEHELERQREIKWGPRTLDIDILFFNQEIIHTEHLKVPHPFLHERRFTLAPLNEIAPDKIHPFLKKEIKILLSECPDKLKAEVIDLKI